jgi:hypothetical protein
MLKRTIRNWILLIWIELQHSNIKKNRSQSWCHDFELESSQHDLDKESLIYSVRIRYIQ